MPRAIPARRGEFDRVKLRLRLGNQCLRSLTSTDSLSSVLTILYGYAPEPSSPMTLETGSHRALSTTSTSLTSQRELSSSAIMRPSWFSVIQCLEAVSTYASPARDPPRGAEKSADAPTVRF